MKTLNVLGTDYKILLDVDCGVLPKGADGCMDYSTKKIKIAKLKTNRNSVQNMKEYRKKVLRHEIVHAFLYESGMWCNSGASDAWGTDETIVDWIAIQSPKIFKAFEEADCI